MRTNRRKWREIDRERKRDRQGAQLSGERRVEGERRQFKELSSKNKVMCNCGCVCVRVRTSDGNLIAWDAPPTQVEYKTRFSGIPLAKLWKDFRSTTCAYNLEKCKDCPGRVDHLRGWMMNVLARHARHERFSPSARVRVHQDNATCEAKCLTGQCERQQVGQ